MFYCILGQTNATFGENKKLFQKHEILIPINSRESEKEGDKAVQSHTFLPPRFLVLFITFDEVLIQTLAH